MSTPNVNKVFLNNSTRMSLNDRFSIMQTIGPKSGDGGGAGPARGRSRSRSRSRARNPVVQPAPRTGGSIRNRKLVDSLEKKHKMRAALKIKNKSIRGGRPRLNRERRTTKRQLRNTMPTVAGRRLRRSNSLANLANIATLNADLVQRGNLRRSNSQTNLAGRLGNRRRPSVGRGRQQQQQLQQQQQIAGGRRRLKRSNSVGRRGNLSRANSQSNLATIAPNTRSRSRSRSRGGGNLARSNSRGNLARSNSQNRQSVLSRLGGNMGPKILATQKRQRANSRTRRPLNRRGTLRGSNANLRQVAPQTRSNSAVRRGGRRDNIIRGRVFKRTSNVGRGNNQATGRVGRTLNRGGASVQGRDRSRSRISRSRVRNQNSNQQPKQNVAANGGNQGQGRNRRRQRGRGGAVARGPGRGGKAGVSGQKQAPRSREQLDNELEQYMANTKSCLDHDMEEYMKGI